MIWINVKCHWAYPIIYFIPSFNLRQNYMTGKSYVYSIIYIYWIIIFNFSIRFKWLISTYIILNFYHTKFFCDREIGQHTAIS